MASLSPGVQPTSLNNVSLFPYFFHEVIMRIAMYLGILLASWSLASSEESTPATLVLTNISVSERARSHSPAVRAGRAEVEASSAQRSAQLSPFLPQVGARMDYRRWGSEPDMGTRHSYQGQIQVEQQLLTFGRLRSTRSLTADAIRAAETDLYGDQRDAALRALIALEGYRFAQATVTVAQARLEQRQGEYADAQKLFEVGNVPMLDVREARINVARAEDSLAQVRADAQRARADLAAALAMEEQAFTVADDLARPNDLDAILAQAHEHLLDGIDLERLTIARESTQTQADLELIDSLPQVSGIAAATTSGSRLNDMDDDWYVGIGLSWTLYDGGGRYARRNAQQANLRRIQAQRDAILDERQRELAVIQADASALAARIALQESIISDTEANYEDARVLYQTGEITLTRVGEAGLAVVEAQFNRNRYLFEESVLAHRLQAFME
ncbi:MAG: TolC family protein [Planctomycetota bacterium]|nr:MAG: TolC family protein [Planctomycetota bacterium]